MSKEIKIELPHSLAIPYTPIATPKKKSSSPSLMQSPLARRLPFIGSPLPSPKTPSMPGTPGTPDTTSKITTPLLFQTPTTPKTPVPSTSSSSSSSMITTPSPPTLPLTPTKKRIFETDKYEYTTSKNKIWSNWNQLAIEIDCPILGLENKTIYVSDTICSVTRKQFGYTLKPIACTLATKIQMGQYSATGCKRENQDKILTCQFIFYGKWYFLSAVMDGHGGMEAVDFVYRWFLPCFMSYSNDMTIKDRLQQTFIDLDDEFLQTTRNSHVGTTLAVFLYEYATSHGWTAHVGDSRILIGDRLDTKDHRPTNLEEFKRFTEDEQQKLCELPMTRSIGDRSWKRLFPSMSCLPTIYEPKSILLGTPILLGTDGLFEKQSNQEILCKFTNIDGISNDKCRDLVQHQLQQLCARDNISVFVCCFIS